MSVPQPIPPVLDSIPALHAFLDQQQRQHHLRIGDVLVASGQLSEMQRARALSDQLHAPRHRKFGEWLVQHGDVSPEAVQQALYTQMGVPRVHLPAFTATPDIISALPSAVARRHQVVPVLMHGEWLVVACAQLPHLDAIAEIEFAARHNVHFVLADETAIRDALFRYYTMADVAAIEQAAQQAVPHVQRLRDETDLANQPPIIRLVNAILHDAIHQRASDIHLRPQRHHAELFYRIDGSLVPVQRLNIGLLPAVVSRLKILATLNIAEHRLPQDGHLQMTVGDNTIDMRLSLIPMTFGESVVIRLLNKQQGLRTLDTIGLSEDDTTRVRNLLARGMGLLLVTGPTGSGKTTTLYAGLQDVARDDLNIITVEDPVEYELQGMRQIQLLEAAGFTFANTLRHILRHDPDVVMIGEIRDGDTARIAVESALTGHLVLSTLHTNDAPGALLRLQEMGVSTYLIRSAVTGVLAQRLVRRNCPHCRVPEHINALLRVQLGLRENENFMRGAGCEHCRQTGYAGRRAVYELFVIDDATQAQLSDTLSASELRRLALANGMTPMFEHGLQFARQGDVSLMELYAAAC